MSNEKSLTVQSTEISSSQDWTIDPSMIEVYIAQAFLEKAAKCVAFMQENDVHKVTIWWAFGYTLFQEVEAVTDEDLEGKEIVKVENGNEYVEFEPEYGLDGAHAEIHKDGHIRAVFPFKHTDDHLSCAVGALRDLQAKTATSTAAPVVVQTADDSLPTVVVEINGGMVNCVRASEPLRLIVLDEDTEGGSTENIVAVNKQDVYVHDYRLTETVVGGFDGIQPEFVADVVEQIEESRQ